MFKVTLEWKKCETEENGKLEQEITFDIFIKIANVLSEFAGISISWPKKGGGGT
jgi:hypothetical protein